MNFPFYIAKRYFFSKKKRSAVNIISWVAVTGVAIGTAALVIVLSVFNGFEELIFSLYSSFDPDIKITAREGKVFDPNKPEFDNVYNMQGVENISEVLEEVALFKHQDRQHIGVMKGVSQNYAQTTGIDSMIISGEFKLKEGSFNNAIIGQGISYFLGTSVDDVVPISIYIPNRKARATFNPRAAFKRKLIFPAGIFAIEQDFDTRYMLVPLEFARDLLEYPKEISALEIKVSNVNNILGVQEKIQEMLGDDYEVLNRYQQNEVFYKVMQTEKWAIFVILTFILIVASFNIIGSITMLVVDKKDDLQVLSTLGASRRMLNRIVLMEGYLITLIGVGTGFVLGLLVCFLQIKFEIVKLQGSGTFVIDAYPVSLQMGDLVMIVGIVLMIGYIAALFPARIMNKRLLYLE